MEDSKKYLAANILTEDKEITYRSLSRALNVHVNAAKRMLHEFHRAQNGKHPGTVFATYLVYGKMTASGPRTPQGTSEDNDVEMTESQSEDDATPTTTLSLVTEEDLKDALAEYEEVTSIHIYSLGPHRSHDFTLLSEVARKVLDSSGPSDAVEARKVYGTITNSQTRRRERQGRGGVQVVPAAKEESTQAAKAVLDADKENAKPKSAVPALAKDTKSSSAPSKKPAALKRGGSGASSIMQAFSKAKPKKPVDKSLPATLSGDDASMHPMSDDGEDDVEVPVPKSKNGSARDSKKEREEALRRMMDADDDEEMEQAEDDEPESPMEEAEEEPVTEKPAKEEPAEVMSASGQGRRRGKRKVMKKKQLTDENGYLVTIQEAAWESFSEDEPAPPPPKTKPANSAPAAKPKKAKGKGQGSIMSFFSKKS